MAQEIYPLVHSSYAVPTTLLWNDQIIQSQEDLQQGDPLCLLLFSLAIHLHCEQLCFPLSVMYLDDVSVGGSFEDVLHDLDVIKEADSLGSTLNTEIIRMILCGGTSLWLSQAQTGQGLLLGSPLGRVASIDANLEEKN